MQSQDIKTLTIRISHKLWIALRHMQEEGKIKSIQEAAIKGLEWITKPK